MDEETNYNSFSDWRDDNETHYESNDAADPDDLAQGYTDSKS